MLLAAGGWKREVKACQVFLSVSSARRARREKRRAGYLLAALPPPKSTRQPSCTPRMHRPSHVQLSRRPLCRCRCQAAARRKKSRCLFRCVFQARHLGPRNQVATCIGAGATSCVRLAFALHTALGVAGGQFSFVFSRKLALMHSPNVQRQEHRSPCSLPDCSVGTHPAQCQQSRAPRRCSPRLRRNTLVLFGRGAVCRSAG